MKKGDIVRFKYKLRFRGQLFLVIGRRRKKPQWLAPKIKVMRVSDGEKLSWTATTAFEVLSEGG